MQDLHPPSPPPTPAVVLFFFFFFSQLYMPKTNQPLSLFSKLIRTMEGSSFCLVLEAQDPEVPQATETTRSSVKPELELRVFIQEWNGLLAVCSWTFCHSSSIYLCLQVWTGPARPANVSTPLMPMTQRAKKSAVIPYCHEVALLSCKNCFMLTSHCSSATGVKWRGSC